MLVLVCVFTLRNPEKVLSHSQDVIGKVANIFNFNSLMLEKTSKSTALKVLTILIRQFHQANDVFIGLTLYQVNDDMANHLHKN